MSSEATRPATDMEVEAVDPAEPLPLGGPKFRRCALLFTLLNPELPGIASKDLVSLGLLSFNCSQRPSALFLPCSPALGI